MLLHVNFYSDILRRECEMDVIYPQDCTFRPKEQKTELKPPYQTLYLLHGIRHVGTAWQRYSSIERYVREMGLVVVMPSTDRMFYTDCKTGYRWAEHIGEEIPEIIRGMFPVSHKREDTFIAGFSMGGYGAFKLASRYPETFGYTASLSGVIDVAQLYDNKGGIMLDFENAAIFGTKEEMENGMDNLFNLIPAKLAQGCQMPKYYQVIGTEDFVYSLNTRFPEVFQDKLDLTYVTAPGAHNWEFWDEHIQNVLEWLPIRQKIAIVTPSLGKKD